MSDKSLLLDGLRKVGEKVMQSLREVAAFNSDELRDGNRKEARVKDAQENFHANMSGVPAKSAAGELKEKPAMKNDVLRSFDDEFSMRVEQFIRYNPHSAAIALNIESVVTYVPENSPDEEYLRNIEPEARAEIMRAYVKQSLAKHQNGRHISVNYADMLAWELIFLADTEQEDEQESFVGKDVGPIQWLDAVDGESAQKLKAKQAVTRINYRTSKEDKGRPPILKCRLFDYANQERGGVVNLQEYPQSIGASVGEIRLDEFPHVSGFHCEIFMENDKLFVEQKGRNPTMLVCEKGEPRIMLTAKGERSELPKFGFLLLAYSEEDSTYDAAIAFAVGNKGLPHPNELRTGRRYTDTVPLKRNPAASQVVIDEFVAKPVNQPQFSSTPESFAGSAPAVEASSERVSTYTDKMSSAMASSASETSPEVEGYAEALQRGGEVFENTKGTLVDTIETDFSCAETEIEFIGKKSPRLAVRYADGIRYLEIGSLPFVLGRGNGSIAATQSRVSREHLVLNAISGSLVEFALRTQPGRLTTMDGEQVAESFSLPIFDASEEGGWLVLGGKVLGQEGTVAIRVEWQE